MGKEISKELLDRYIHNLCTDAERQFVDNWYDSYESLPPLFADEDNDEAQRWNIDLKDDIKLKINDLEKNENISLKQVSLIQSWFLKASNKLLREN